MEMSEGTKGMKWADSQGLWTNVCKPTAGGFEANFANAKLAQDRTAFWIPGPTRPRPKPVSHLWTKGYGKAHTNHTDTQKDTHISTNTNKREETHTHTNPHTQTHAQAHAHARAHTERERDVYIYIQSMEIDRQIYSQMDS